MKVMILAGGLGTRLAEETSVRPKPMVEIGGMPMLWHIMKIYESHGFNDFIILLGYKGYVIKEYFSNYYLHTSDVTIDLAENRTIVHNNRSEKWRITLIDTGELAMTGARVRKAKAYTEGKPFMLTYGDGVADVNIRALAEAHRQSGKAITMTSVQPEGRFGALDINESNEIVRFAEKPKGDGNWINGGFFVCEQSVFDYLPEGDDLVFEQDPLRRLAEDGQMNAFRHTGFWKPMDALRDKQQLESLWAKNQAPWKVW
ncbi:glucose-1-phosphate cytidylyltransferase [Comamonas odontotermitis]|uniref:Glucose-1-phosphate cytidylyltransferase n=1 Tax=Comamonas odontotermitis TaxID=379895 RepID=A0ABR6RAV4_9BURK|nr:glucose-1-phosphate cytidylyltransferase [Comamonas odontotermitis]MBB6576278.1 glucose-1-phosphate cytidylyltransferase [Comamonas odontotermitis]